MSALLETAGLTRRFGGLVAVDDLALKIEEGSIWAIIGPNGAGKTTAFNVVTGFLSPSGGSVRYAGRDITGQPAHRLVEQGIARTFQNIRLFPLMTALENVVTGAHARLKSHPLGAILALPSSRREELEAERAGMALLERVGLAAEADTLAGELPYGSQRRLEIARALASKPRLLLLDEPAAGANPYESAVLARLIRDIRDSGVTVVLIEHDMSVVMRLSDGITVLDHGRKLAEGSPETIRDDDRVIEAYLGRDSGADTRRRAAAPVAGARSALELQGLEVSYGAIAAVKGIDLGVDEGEVITLIGANGAGKSTSLKAIAGVVRPRAGSIRLFGERVTDAGAEAMVGRGVVLVPEGRQIFGRMSVHENLLMGAHQRSDGPEVAQDVDYVFGLFPILRERRDQFGGTLSGGEQQMLAIGRALMARPRILMLDEPSLGLSPVLVQQVFEFIARLRDEGRTILLVEQNARMALSVANRGYVIQTGRIVLHGSAATLLESAQVRDAYFGSDVA
jgi:ABC-type branched-subunit amino acid transport system ATPase component